MDEASLPQWSIADTMADASTLNALAAWATALQAAEHKLDNDLRLLIDRMSRLEEALGGVDIESRLSKIESEIYQSHTKQESDEGSVAESANDVEDDNGDEDQTRPGKVSPNSKRKRSH